MENSKLLKNLIEALQMMPDMDGKEMDKDLESDPKAKGLEMIKVKALGDHGDDDSEILRDDSDMSEDDDSLPIENAMDIMKKKKMLMGHE